MNESDLPIQIRSAISQAAEARQRVLRVAQAAAELLCLPGALSLVGWRERAQLKRLLRSVDGRNGRMR